jgi:predicted dehydrogenase
VNISVLGTDHGHVIELAFRLRDAGATVVAVVPTEDKIGPWLASQFPDARGDDPYADDVDVVVTAAIPSERAGIAAVAMRAGKDVVADKPGATNVAQLDALRACCAETGRGYWVIFAERMSSPAMLTAQRLVREGRLGTVLHTMGLGPHTLNLPQRPEWFSDPARYGGILVDIGSHQVDQFLTFTESSNAEVAAATVRAHDEHPGLQVLGEMLLRADDGRTGYTRVDYFTPAGLGSWGDVRFTVVGTDGFLEVVHMTHSVTVVDGDGRETIDCQGGSVHWAKDVVEGRAPVAQEHVFAVTDICLRAQAAAAHV